MKKNRVFISGVAISMMLFLAACADIGDNKMVDRPDNKEAVSGEEGMQNNTYQKISAQEAKEMMDALSDEIILDVRTAEEYEEKHIPNAILIPNETIEDTRPEELSTEDTILVYCRSGNRSKQAAEKLAAMGYKNVYEFGGIQDWTYDTQEGPYMPVQTGEAGNKQTDTPELTGEFQAFESYDLDLEAVNQDVLKGYDLTVINLWGTYCSPCIREMPGLGEIAREYKDQGVQIIGIPIDVKSKEDVETIVKARQIVRETEADYKHILPSADLANIYLNEVNAVPETLFVDSSGTIIKSVVGANSKEKWEKIINQLLEEVRADD